MDLTPTTTVSQPVDDKQWLGSLHGTDCTRSITLDVATFASVKTAAQNGLRATIPSGVPLKKVGNKYALATGADVAVGHLYETVLLNPTSTAAGGALLWHGVVVAARVPGTFVPANQVASGAILYV